MIQNRLLICIKPVKLTNDQDIPIIMN